MNAESSKQKDGDLSAEQIKVIELGVALIKSKDILEDFEAEYKGHLWEADNLKKSRIPTAKENLAEAQRKYEEAGGYGAYKEAKEVKK